MRKIKAGTLLINTKILNNSNALETSYRLAARIEADQVLLVDDGQVQKYLSTTAGLGDRGQSGIQKSKPLVILDRSRWDRSDILIGMAHPRSALRMMENHGAVCHDGFNIHTAYGCPNRCDYCCYGNILYIRVDANNFVERLQKTIEAMGPGLYKWDNRSDIMEFEPEVGFLPRMTDLFRRYTDKVLMVYTKSGDAAQLLDIEPNPQLIICWSVSTQTQERHMERGVASTVRRLEAARLCQKAGHRIRIRISPMVPTLGWKTEIEQLSSLIFHAHGLEPEIVTLKTLGFMPNIQTFHKLMDRVLDFFDPEVLRSIEDSAAVMNGNRSGPLPDHIREQMYRHTVQCIRSVSQIPVSICHESHDVWTSLSDLLSISSTRCCCSNDSAHADLVRSLQ